MTAAERQVKFAYRLVAARTDEPPPPTAKVRSGAFEENPVVNFELFAGPVIRHLVLQTDPAIPGITHICLAFGIKVPVGAGELQHRTNASAGPHQAVATQIIN